MSDQATITVASGDEAVVVDNLTLSQQQGEGEGMADKEKAATDAKKSSKPWAQPKDYGTADWYWKRDSDVLQLSHMTSEERFPKIFDSAKTLQPDAKRVLSFGCSTGEEAQALAKRFPNAEIVGVDIDYSSVSSARKKNKLPNVHFHTALGATGKYDVVTALQVFFCMEKPIPPDRWTKTLRSIDPHLNAGGILMIYTSDYDPAVVLGDNYEPVNAWVREHNKNKKLYFNGYYRKKADVPLPETDMAKVIPHPQPEKPAEPTPEPVKEGTVLKDASTLTDDGCPHAAVEPVLSDAALQAG